MKQIIQKLRQGDVIQIITPTLQREQIQLNKSESFVCWERFTMPVNGDKSRAKKLNERLTLKEVVQIVKHNAEQLKTVDL